MTYLCRHSIQSLIFFCLVPLATPDACTANVNALISSRHSTFLSLEAYCLPGSWVRHCWNIAVPRLVSDSIVQSTGYECLCLFQILCQVCQRIRSAPVSCRCNIKIHFAAVAGSREVLTQSKIVLLCSSWRIYLTILVCRKGTLEIGEIRQILLHKKLVNPGSICCGIRIQDWQRLSHDWRSYRQVRWYVDSVLNFFCSLWT